MVAPIVRGKPARVEATSSTTSESQGDLAMITIEMDEKTESGIDA